MIRLGLRSPISDSRLANSLSGTQKNNSFPSRSLMTRVGFPHRVSARTHGGSCAMVAKKQTIAIKVFDHEAPETIIAVR